MNQTDLIKEQTEAIREQTKAIREQTIAIKTALSYLGSVLSQTPSTGVGAGSSPDEVLLKIDRFMEKHINDSELV